MNQIYEVWKSEPFPLKESPDIILNKIASVVKYLSQFYGFVGLESNEVQILFRFILEYLKKYPRFKLCDIDRSIELFKKRPELNKLCPEYFETIFEKYRKSDERKLILKTWEEDLEAHANELTEAKKEYDPQELLQICFNNWKQTGIIQLNSGLVYTKNFVLLKDKIGLYKMEELRQEAKSRLIKQFEETLSRLPKTSNLRDEANSQLELIKKDSGLLKPETRRAHLQYYFETINNKT